jgi:predicted RNase H-like nuclease (RuvC/YqgF family)
MSERASVGSVEALRAFKPAVIKFAELTQASLSTSEGTATRALDWIVRDRRPQLQREIRRLQEEMTRSRTRMISRMDPGQDNPSPKVDDRLEYEAAKRRLREAEAKLEQTRVWARQLERAIEEYKGAVSQLGWFVRGELGRAVGAIDQMGDALESYIQLGERRHATPEPLPPNPGGAP